MFETQPIHAATTACRKCLMGCLNIPRLNENGWAENRLVDFNLWAAGAGVSAKGKLSLDQRLSTRPEVQTTLVNLLELLQMFVENCQDQGKPDLHPVQMRFIRLTRSCLRVSAQNLDSSHNDSTKAEQSIDIRSSGNSALDKEETAEPIVSELSSEESEARRDVEVTLDQIIRLTVAIRKAGSNARLKRADKSFNAESPEIKDLKSFLELLIHPRGFKEEGKLSQIQIRLIEANLRRWHRFSYAKRHSKKLARSETALMEVIPEAPTTISEDIPLLDTKTVVSFDIPKIEVPPDEAPRALSVIAPTATTAASAIESSIMIPDKVIARNTTTVISRISSRIAYPRPPAISQYQTVFKCPCCLQSLPVAYTERSQWKKHLASDILPYTCVFPDCQQPLQLYLTRKDWESHIQTEHGQSWNCAVCEQLGVTTEFLAEEELVSHLETIHQDSVDRDEISMFVTASSSFKPVEAIDCPICAGPSEAEDSLEHIAHCVHDFSLNSLPLPSDSDAEDEYFDIDSRNSDLQNTPSSISAEERDVEDLEELVYDTASVDDEHKPLESLLEKLIGDASESKEISILDWRSGQTTEDQIDLSTEAPGEIPELQTELQTEAAVDSLYGPAHRALYKIAWLCPSKMDAEVAEALLDTVVLVPLTSQSSGSKFDYRLGRIESHNVVVVWPSESSQKNRKDAWCLATEAAKSFKSLIIFLHVGTTAGIPSQVGLSDVVIGTPEEGKILQYRFKKNNLGHVMTQPFGGHFKTTPIPILRALGYMKQTFSNSYLQLLLDRNRTKIAGYPRTEELYDVQFAPDVFHVDEEEGTCRFCPEHPDNKLRPYSGPNIYYDGIACGDLRIDNDDTRERFSRAVQNARRQEVRCVETEHGPTGLLAHVDTQGLVVIRGISGYTDRHKDMRWKKIATLTAAVYARAFIGSLQFVPEEWDHPESFLDISLKIEDTIPASGGDDGTPGDSVSGASQTEDDYEDFINPELFNENESLEAARTKPHEPDILQTKCIFWEVRCPYVASDFDSWADHIKKHLAHPSHKDPPEYPVRRAQPWSWKCGFPSCVTTIPLDSRGSKAKVLKSKLKHIYEHLTEDGMDPADCIEEDNWAAYFQSIPIKLLDSEDEPEQARNPKSPESEFKDDSLRIQISDWLTHIDFQPIQENYSQSFMVRTRLHILAETELRDWLEMPDRAILCTGNPGVGKTYLTAMVYDDLRERFGDSAGIAVIYCNTFRSTNESVTVEILLRCILKQFTQQVKNIPDELVQMYSSHSRRYPDERYGRISFDELVTLLEVILKKFLRSFVLIDGVDELKLNIAEDWRTLFEAIKRLSISLGLNSFYTSRDEQLIKNNMDSDAYPANKIRPYVSREIAMGMLPTIQNAVIFLHRDFSDFRFGFLAEDQNFLEDLMESVDLMSIGIFALATMAAKHIVSITSATHRNRRGAEGDIFHETSHGSPQRNRRRAKEDTFHVPSYETSYERPQRRIVPETRGFSAVLTGNYGSIPFRKWALYDVLRAHTSDQIRALVTIDYILSLCHCFQIESENSDKVIPFRPTAYEYFRRSNWVWYPGGSLSALEGLTEYLSNDAFRTGPCPDKKSYDERIKNNPYFPRASKEWAGIMAGVRWSISLTPALRTQLDVFLINDDLVASLNQVLKLDKEDPPDYDTSVPIQGIHLAAQFGLEWAIKSLVPKQDVNARDYNDHTPVARAIDANKLEVLEELIHNGASLTDIKHAGSTALLEAIRLNIDNRTIISALIRSGADIDAAGTPSGSENSYTPLTLAIYQHREAIVQLLIDKGARISLPDGQDRTPLLCAVMVGNLKIASLLISSGADLEATRDRYTPLYYAVFTGQREVVELLVACGAKVTGGYGRGTLADHARSRGLDEIADFLVQEGSIESPRFGETRMPLLPLDSLEDDYRRFESATGNGSTSYIALCHHHSCGVSASSTTRTRAIANLYQYHQKKEHSDWLLGTPREYRCRVRQVIPYKERDRKTLFH